MHEPEARPGQPDQVKPEAESKRSYDGKGKHTTGQMVKSSNEKIVSSCSLKSCLPDCKENFPDCVMKIPHCTRASPTKREGKQNITNKFKFKMLHILWLMPFILYIFSITDSENNLRMSEPEAQSGQPDQVKPEAESRCKKCGKTFKLLLSHLERTKTCQKSYDMESMREEAKRLHREKMAARNRYLYHNDPSVSTRKRAASMKLYQENPTKKKYAMAAYNETHKKDINAAMRNKNYESRTEYTCHVCKNTFKTKKSMNFHIKNTHGGTYPPLPCPICEKKITNLQRHLREVHSQEKFHCDKCSATFSRNSDLKRHIREDDHHTSYYCSACNSNLVFKHLGGLINHVIVKEISGFSSRKLVCIIHKSGMVVTCKSQVESSLLEEGRCPGPECQISCMTENKKVEEEMHRARKKEEIINLGLTRNDEPKGVQVKLEFKRKKHEAFMENAGKCKWCFQKIKNANEYCPDRYPVEDWTRYKAKL